MIAVCLLMGGLVPMLFDQIAMARHDRAKRRTGGRGE